MLTVSCEHHSHLVLLSMGTAQVPVFCAQESASAIPNPNKQPTEKVSRPNQCFSRMQPTLEMLDLWAQFPKEITHFLDRSLHQIPSRRLNRRRGPTSGSGSQAGIPESLACERKGDDPGWALREDYIIGSLIPTASGSGTAHMAVGQSLPGRSSYMVDQGSRF